MVRTIETLSIIKNNSITKLKLNIMEILFTYIPKDLLIDIIRLSTLYKEKEENEINIEDDEYKQRVNKTINDLKTKMFENE